jgi:SsrA-binding protein
VAKPTPDGRKIISENRKARHDFHILETVEAGLSLVGTEVKSLRSGTCTLGEAWVRIDNGEAWVSGMHIPPYDQGNIHNHDPLRDRKLLLHRREIDDLHEHVSRKGNTLVVLSLYFSHGRAKMTVAVARGKQKIDKRHAIADRDAKRQIARDFKMNLR